MSDRGQWQLAGNAAGTYERVLTPAVFAAWAPVVVALADPRSGERVLDVACGTGVVTRLVARQVDRTGKVVGLDLNPGMLAVAAAAAASEPSTSASITRQEASANGSIGRTLRTGLRGRVAARGHVAKVSDEARAALVGEVGDALRSHLAGGALAFPIEAHLASARK